MSLFRFNKRYSLAVTAADNWLANAIIRGLLSDAGKSELRVQALTQYPKDPNVLDLKKHGAEIDGINYKRPDSLTNSLHNTNAIIFVAEVDKDRIKQAQAMAKAAKKANVEGAIILSVEGAGKADLDTQHDFNEIEKIWKDSGLDCVAVLQLSFLQQGFFLLSPAVQHTGKLLWLPQKQEKFTPVNLHDVVLSIQSLFASHKGNFVSLDKKHHRKTYLLTGPDSIDGRNIVNVINKAIHGEGEVELRNVDRSELGRYLSRLGSGKEHEHERDRDLGLTQRTAAQFIHNGFASLHESFAELIKGNEYNLGRGVNTFNDGVDFLERAISCLEDDQFENQRTRVMHSADNFDIRRIVAPLEQLRNSRIERVFNLTPEERAIYLEELVAIVEQMKSRVDVGSLRHHNEPQHEENYPVPFLPLQEIEVQLILDILEFVNTGKAGKKTDDVEHITHHKPEAVTSFFKKNYKKFVPDNQHRHGNDDDRDNYSRNAIADREGRSRL